MNDQGEKSADEINRGTSDKDFMAESSESTSFEFARNVWGDKTYDDDPMQELRPPDADSPVEEDEDEWDEEFEANSESLVEDAENQSRTSKDSSNIPVVSPESYGGKGIFRESSNGASSSDSSDDDYVCSKNSVVKCSYGAERMEKDDEEVDSEEEQSVAQIPSDNEHPSSDGCKNEAPGKMSEASVKNEERPRILKGMSGWCQYWENNLWYKARIRDVDESGTMCTVRYYDGRLEYSVPESSLRGMRKSGVDKATPDFYVGMRSKCRAVSGGEGETHPYYSGRIVEYDADSDAIQFEFDTAGIINASTEDLLFWKVPQPRTTPRSHQSVEEVSSTGTYVSAHESSHDVRDNPVSNEKRIKRGIRAVSEGSQERKKARCPKLSTNVRRNRSECSLVSAANKVDDIVKELESEVNSFIERAQRLARDLKTFRRKTRQQMDNGLSNNERKRRMTTPGTLGIVAQTKRRGPKQCGKCTNCLIKECGKCVNCRDKPKFGGPGIKHQRCIRRPKCLLYHQSKGK